MVPQSRNMCELFVRFEIELFAFVDECDELMVSEFSYNWFRQITNHHAYIKVGYGYSLPLHYSVII
jgi:hypothetical protein